MSARSYDIEYLYNGDRWRDSTTKEEYEIQVRNMNGIVYGQLIYHPTKKSSGTYLFGGLPNIFAPMFKDFIRCKHGTVKRVRRRAKDRTGERITLWW